ncbi:hypothetical protein A2Z00_00705 [Candidatus Gottesmanbacteria bacterium RBG_13_45_10]|uniref:Uncharacterized protein n=1 Tax=Candidatus Gottesmanbacteria bacterium RBG_13_45_10 TaxID=1798370 RepID=A0A1F5ZH95_9BACT|nr:MAG: hypothetical protein A2Z00_00705 [Candidatus Gottesmanbacteria bacterium RBG_13_45_10]
MSNISRSIFSFVLVSSLLMIPAGVMATTTAATKSAMEKTDVMATTATQLKEDAAMEKVEYTLPYPGILQDNPLYFLKNIRDRIMDMLISDPVHKAEFYILQTDKHLSAGMMLSTQGKTVLSESVIASGEKYMENAVNGLKTYKNQGKKVPPYLVDRLTQSTAKHNEVLEEMVAKAAEAEKSGLSNSLALVQKLQGEITNLK